MVQVVNDEMAEQQEQTPDITDVEVDDELDEMVQMQIALFEVEIDELVHLTLYLEHQ